MSYGLIGLGAMGSNLALNISKKQKLYIYDRTYAKVKSTIKTGTSTNLIGHKTMEDMISKMENPRTIITLLPQGKPTFELINNLVNILDKDDTIIDSANEHYKAGTLLEELCEIEDVNFLGIGMSGGSKGALNGPGIMVGGKEKTFKTQQKYLNSFCENVVHINDDPSSGHYAKMVHNGIEYGMLQGICDIFSYLNQDPEIMKEFLLNCFNSEIDGLLIQNAVDVLNEYNLDDIQDIASMNNTGLWCSQIAMENMIPLPIISNGVNARIYSKYKDNNNEIRTNIDIDTESAVKALEFIYAYSILEGISLLDIKNIERSKAQFSWSKGTIIECKMIEYSRQRLLEKIELNVKSARRVFLQCVFYEIPVPVLSNAIDFYDFTHETKTSISLLMAQRNKFGEHKYKTFKK
tara:strand:- start:929 stop:2149 length:1221 start_codon:yes stop_codon:yes gene_type:complete